MVVQRGRRMGVPAPGENGPVRTLESLVWAWPDTPIHLVVLALVAIVVRGLVGWAIRRTVLASTLRTQQHLERLGRPGQILARASGLDHERRDQRTRTVAQLLGSTASVVIFGVALLTALDVIGLPLQPVLASAGVGGVALAFGAQSLVKDVISGVFMIVSIRSIILATLRSSLEMSKITANSSPPSRTT